MLKLSSTILADLWANIATPLPSLVFLWPLVDGILSSVSLNFLTDHISCNTNNFAWFTVAVNCSKSFVVVRRGVATGGYIGIYTPKSVTVLFACGTLTRFEIAMTS